MTASHLLLDRPQAVRQRAQGPRSIRRFGCQFLLGAVALAVLGCEIERTAEGQGKEEAAQDTVERSPAARSLTEALSPSNKKKQPPPPVEPPKPQVRDDPPEEEPGPARHVPKGASLTELQEWVAAAPWFRGGESDQVTPKGSTAPKRALFVYGGGAAVELLHLPESTPLGGVDAVVALTEGLEHSSLTNAGFGAARRLDGSIEVEALLRDGSGTTGAVFGVEDVRNPIRLAAALERAGGAQIRGNATKALAKKLDLELSSLGTPDSQKQYVLDLARYLERPNQQDNLALFHLFVDPKVASEALARKTEPPNAPPRDPVLVVLSSSDGQLVIAASHGGRALSLPGAPSLLDDERVLSWEGSRMAMVLASSSCDFLASRLLEPQSRLRFVTRQLDKECPGAFYVALGDGVLETNLPSDRYEQAVFPPEVDESATPRPDEAKEPLPSVTAPQAPAPKISPDSGVKDPKTGVTDSKTGVTDSKGGPP